MRLTMAKDGDGLHQNNSINNNNKSDNKLQMVAIDNGTDSCVTPNVPRLRNSFFNRKYRDISSGSGAQFTPQTPKITKSRAASSRSRARRSTSGSRRNNSGNRNGGRPNRSRPMDYEFNELDFSTPRTTRSLLTPTRSARVDRHGRIRHLVYRPLELDNNDSSSDNTNDSFMRKRQSQQPRPNDVPPAIEAPLAAEVPLAIEAANAEVTLTIHDKDSSTSVTTKPKNTITLADPQKDRLNQEVVVLDSQPKKVRTYEVITIDDSDDSNDENEKVVKKVKSSVPNGRQRKISEWSQTKLKSSQCITPPTTPPEKKENKQIDPNITPARCSMFIPGQCNIDEIIHLYADNN